MRKMRKVFISYRHNAYKGIKDELIAINNKFNLFIDRSMNLGDVSGNLPAETETIMKIIREKKLQDSTITLFIYGKKVNERKFIDWELAGSMTKYKESKQNAIIVINTRKFTHSALNTNPADVAVGACTFNRISKTDTKNEKFWRTSLPNAPERLIKNMARKNVNINVIRLKDILAKPYLLRNLIEKVYKDRLKNEYDTSIPLKRENG